MCDHDMGALVSEARYGRVSWNVENSRKICAEKKLIDSIEAELMARS